MALTYRELTPEEWDLRPHDVPGRDVYTPENSKVLAAFNDRGEVVATWTVFTMVHVEPLYIRPDYRGSTTILKRMAQNMKRLLQYYGISQVYTVVLDTTPVLAKFAKWFGGTPIKGTLYTWFSKEH